MNVEEAHDWLNRTILELEEKSLEYEEIVKPAMLHVRMRLVDLRDRRTKLNVLREKILRGESVTATEIQNIIPMSWRE
jgi:hypothetical protein